MAAKIYLGASVGLLLLACGGSTFEVGDALDGGTVTEVTGDGDCQVVTVRHDAAWTCSAAQLEQVQSGNPYPNYPSGAAMPYADPAELPEPGSERVELLPTSCEGLAELRRPALKARQRQQLDSAQHAILLDKCLGKSTHKYFQDGVETSYCNVRAAVPAGGPNYSGFGGAASSIGPSPSIGADDPDGVMGPDADGAGEYSTTNTQVVGVDEADFVKNDAEHVYVLSSAGLHVIDAWPALETKQLRLLPIPGEPRRMFLDGDQLVVYSRLGAPPADAYGGSATPSQQGCTYGYDCRFSAEPGQTMVIVFDVSTPEMPRALQSFVLSGNYVASRRVGQYVYTVVHDGEMGSLPGLDLNLAASSPEELDALYQARLEQANEAVDNAAPAHFLPWVHRTDESGRTREEVAACDNVLAAQAAQGQSFISLVSLDLRTLANPTRTLLAAKPGYVYASGTALYLATDGVDGGDFLYPRSTPAADRSTIHKFALDGASTSYRGSAAITGHVLNQFSMDELDGVLRVATSTGWVPDPGVSSNLLTLSEQNGAFVALGSLGGIAPTEDIRSVRFDGTRAFVVTFKKTDPLFVFDLTDPAAPSTLGELKIPGFSTYMQPMDRDHLLAIGFDADDQGDFAYFDGIQIQIFDVSELSTPKLMHKTTIGTRGSASEALTNHLAFNYFPSKGVLALPMTVCEGGDNGVYADELTFSGLMVFDVSLASGLTERGRMPFVDTAKVAASSPGSFSCGNWWTQSSSDVKRSIFMADYAVGISDTLYQVAPLADLDGIIGKLPLGQ